MKMATSNFAIVETNKELQQIMMIIRVQNTHITHLQEPTHNINENYLFASFLCKSNVHCHKPSAIQYKIPFAIE